MVSLPVQTTAVMLDNSRHAVKVRQVLLHVQIIIHAKILQPVEHVKMASRLVRTIQVMLDN